MIDSSRFGHAGFRPILCESGPGFVMRQRRFFNRAALERPHLLDGYSPEHLAPLLETNANVFFLLFSQGFGSDAECEGREAFRAAAEFLRGQGAYVFAAVHTGHADSKRGLSQDCFSRRRNGKNTPSWIPGFKTTCWTNPQWIEAVAGDVRAAIDSGADGVWLDNIISGAAPAAIGPFLLGDIGCACPRCAEKFAAYSGSGSKVFPPRADDPAFSKYVEWRADVATSAVRIWRDAAVAAKSDAMIAMNLLMPAQLDSRTIFGADPAKLCPLADIVTCETNNMISFDKSGLTYDSATLEVMGGHAPGIEICNIPWRTGPNLDTAPHVQFLRAAMCEAVSCGAAPSLRSSAFWDEKSLEPKTLAQDDFKELREAASAIWNWIDRTPEPFTSCIPRAQTALLHQTPDAPEHTAQFLARFFKTYQTLTELHIPLKVIHEKRLGEHLPDETALVIIPEGDSVSDDAKSSLLDFAARGKLLFIGENPGWAPEGTPPCLDSAIFPDPVPPKAAGAFRRNLLDKRHSGATAAYYQHRFPAPGPAAAMLINAGRFLVPADWKKVFDTVTALLNGIGRDVEIEGPPYIHAREWRSGSTGNTYFQVFNLLPAFPGHKVIQFRFPGAVAARIMTPDRNKIVYTQNRSFQLEVKTYTVIEIKNRK